MKRQLKQLAMALTLALSIVATSAVVANSCEAGSFTAAEQGNVAVCKYAKETETGCMYICTCWGNCSAIYKQYGLIKI